ncbi:MAG: galactosyldiacylglycerol synthase [Rubrivivax sp.]|nr:galactosyldiacylglycerol synthase [Rubrivivax sp.]
MKSIALVHFNAGGGHRAAALALQEAIAQQGRPWRVELVNLTEVLDPRGRFRRLTGIDPEDLYNRRLARGWTLGLAQELKLLQGLIRLTHGRLVQALQQHWLRTEPDLVVSLIPNFNRALYESLAGTLPGVPYVTVLTDMADLPPHFWIEPGQQQHIVCGSTEALAQAQAAGYREDQLSLTSGMVMRPSFYAASQASRGLDRKAGLATLGLDPERPTGLVLFGGQGSTQMLSIAKRLGDQQLILMCGHNQPLAAGLRRLHRAAPHAVIGFTPEVARVMRLADYFIGKPGPGSLSEAVHMGLPVITFHNAWTMPQERFNTRWVREQGVGQVVPSVRALPGAVAAVLHKLPALHKRLQAIDNQAVYEVTDILADLLERAGAPARTPTVQQLMGEP